MKKNKVNSADISVEEFKCKEDGDVMFLNKFDLKIILRILESFGGKLEKMISNKKMTKDDWASMDVFNQCIKKASEIINRVF